MAFAASPGRDGRFLARMSGRAAAAALVGGLVLGGGVAAAATGALPDPVQKATKGVLAKVGVHVPGPNKHANEHASQHGKSTAKPHGRKDAGTGNAVSDLARSTTATGVDKGALISGFASDGKSHAGQHGKAGTAAPSPKASSRHNGSTHQPKTSRHARTVPPKGTPPSPAHTGTGP